MHHRTALKTIVQFMEWSTIHTQQFPYAHRSHPIRHNPVGPLYANCGNPWSWRLLVYLPMWSWDLDKRQLRGSPLRFVPKLQLDDPIYCSSLLTASSSSTASSSGIWQHEATRSSPCIERRIRFSARCMISGGTPFIAAQLPRC